MITQTFITELELAIIRSNTQAAKKSDLSRGVNTNFLYAAQARNGFVQAFMQSFQEQRSILEREIHNGGHGDYAKLFDKVSKLVEQKLGGELVRNDNRLNDVALSKIIRELKVEVRDVFYDGYLAPK